MANEAWINRQTDRQTDRQMFRIALINTHCPFTESKYRESTKCRMFKTACTCLLTANTSKQCGNTQGFPQKPRMWRIIIFPLVLQQSDTWFNTKRSSNVQLFSLAIKCALCALARTDGPHPTFAGRMQLQHVGRSDFLHEIQKFQTYTQEGKKLEWWPTALRQTVFYSHVFCMQNGRPAGRPTPPLIYSRHITLDKLLTASPQA